MVSQQLAFLTKGTMFELVVVVIVAALAMVR